MSIAEERQEINEMEAGMEKNTGAQQEEALQFSNCGTASALSGRI
ncbi:hypothetical protein CLOSTHATH_05886 [Hungatella hathewayi DSM 13479]|jgi:hypothetical protein|uniref:Uncharacterized protein n=1 Tax=Hungatella hathewayi DSM 13479 TaxID=566550 RepID=D3AQI0_9FIRM|nr:hypothetical protein CLOSTHATH_05886 [Hungatella hathewayi DSM 13479]